MCVIGNPPYAVSSSNKGEWIQNLIKDYKKDLNEKNKQPLSDDYIKFIRYGEYLINKNGEGILAYISNNSFIDGIIHRQMRKHLLETFDNIYILDLHGNAKKKETAPDGTPDRNVFDIMQGVSINIFVKSSNKKEKQQCKVFNYDLYGKRQKKYNFLNNNSLKWIAWEDLNNKEPYFFFVPKNFENINKYNQKINLRELFTVSSIGVVTGKDKDFVNDEAFILEDNKKIELTSFYYRHFDFKYLKYDNNTLQRARYSVMKNYLNRKNYDLNISRQSKLKGIEVLVSKSITSKHLITGGTYNLPLYIYPDKKNLFEGAESEKIRLQHKLEQAKEHFAKVSKYFYETVVPYYKKLENPDEINTNLYEENKNLYEEAKASVNSLNIQLKEKTTKSPKDKTLTRVSNLNMAIVEQFAKKIGLAFVSELPNVETLPVETLHATSLQQKRKLFAPIDILDYIYAVLHSPTYRRISENRFSTCSVSEKHRNLLAISTVGRRASSNSFVRKPKSRRIHHHISHRWHKPSKHQNSQKRLAN